MYNLTVYFSIRLMQQKAMIIGGRFYKQGGNVVECNNERVHASIVVMEKQCVTYSECVFVAISIQHALLLRHIVICGLSGCTVIFHIIS